jgi:hypothetical protein
VIQQPFGQSELRDMIGAALAQPPDAVPRAVVTQGKTVFQYLGKLDRPRQIGFASGTSRTIYDFRSRRVQIDGASWRRAEDLQPDAIPRLQQLVHTWERMMLARAAAGRTPDR